MAKTKNSDQVVVDRRGQSDRRQAQDRRRKNVPVTVERRTEQRRKTPRRRQIDPTTCERDYSMDEIEFMQALDAYKRANGRMFPTCSEILEVIRKLGYQKVLAPPAAAELVETADAATAVECDDSFTDGEAEEFDDGEDA